MKNRRGTSSGGSATATLPSEASRHLQVGVAAIDAAIRCVMHAGRPPHKGALLKATSEALESLIRQGIVRLRSPAIRRPLSTKERVLLAEGGFNLQPADPRKADPVAVGAAEFALLESTSLSVTEAAGTLEVNDSRIRQRLTGKPPTLYGFKKGDDWRIPRFQFAGKKTIPGLEEALAFLPRDLDPVSVYRWFSTPNPDLTIGEEEQLVSPLDWLRMGKAPRAVAELAREL